MSKKNQQATEQEDNTPPANVNDQTQNDQTHTESPAVALVKMQKDDGSTADVHPDEVVNYTLGDWKVVQ